MRDKTSGMVEFDPRSVQTGYEPMRYLLSALERHGIAWGPGDGPEVLTGKVAALVAMLEVRLGTVHIRHDS